MNREDYIAEAERQLHDSVVTDDGTTLPYYKSVDQKEIHKQYKEVEDVLKEGVQNGYISKELAADLLPPKAKGGSLYFLRKTHKPFEGNMPKGHPIVSGSGTNTERISSVFCDQAVKYQLKDIKTYLKDTPDLLQKINVINDSGEVPDGTIPISIDLVSMYTRIPLDEGIAAFKVALDKLTDKTVPTEFILKLLRMVMEQNIFMFNNQAWLQLLGTSMGSRVSPTYACLFMSLLEESMLENCPQHLKQYLYLWLRYIDDYLLFWSGTWDQFMEFYEYLNNFHKTMKFDKPQYDQETNSCNFLDLKISIENKKILTDLYKNQLFSTIFCTYSSNFHHILLFHPLCTFFGLFKGFNWPPGPRTMLMG